MRIRPVGTHALLLDLASPEDTVPTAAPGREGDVAVAVEAWRAELWRRRDLGELVAVEIVPAAATVLLDGVPDPPATAARLATWTPIALSASATDAADAATSESAPAQAATTRAAAAQAATGEAAVEVATGETAGQSRLVEVPVTYDGEDLSRVADHWGVDVPGVVRRLGDTEFRVAFCGFAPGFGYLTGLPAELAVPRLATPRPRVPAGSVALAGRYAGIYPSASPGGWLLVGRTDLTLFDVTADPPALLSPGTCVRLVQR